MPCQLCPRRGRRDSRGDCRPGGRPPVRGCPHRPPRDDPGDCLILVTECALVAYCRRYLPDILGNVRVSRLAFLGGLLMFTKKWSAWPQFSEHREHEELSRLIARAATPWDQGAVLAVAAKWCDWQFQPTMTCNSVPGLSRLMLIRFSR